MGESNRFLSIFTKDLGLVSAASQGLRELKSKLRYSLQDFSYAKVDLVRGKDVWRVTSAEKIHKLDSLIKDKDKKVVFFKITSLIKRLFVGEGDHADLFDEIVSGFLFLERETFTKEELVFFEIVLVLKILNNLGYWGVYDELEGFLEQGAWSKDLIRRMGPHAPSVLSEINQALKSSHL